MRRHPVAAPLTAFVALCGLVGGVAFAHGPAPVALSILAVEDGAPSFVHTNIGLAVANEEGTFDYVCPSRWDGNERALAAVSRGGTVLVQSLGLAYVSADDGCSFVPVDLGDDYVTAVTPFRDGFAALVEDEAGVRRVLTLDSEGRPGTLSLALPASPDGLLGDSDALWLAGAGPPGFVARVDADGVEVRFEGAFPDAGRAVPVSADDAGAWVQLAGASLALVRVEDGAMGPARSFERSCHGPIHVGGETLAMFDGELFVFDGQWQPRGERGWTCLEQRGELGLACSLEGTTEIGAVPAPFFSMRQIGPPQSCGDAEAQIECSREWAHYGGESGWLETEPAPDPASPRRPMGCAASAGAPAGEGAVYLVLFLLWGRRKAARRRSL